MNKLDHALALAAKGWYVHPCEPNGKKALLDRWQSRCTNDPNIVREMWEQYPDANIAIVPARSGLAVLDIDCKNGKSGLASLEALDPSGSMSPLFVDTPVSITPSGGYHVFFQFAGDPVPNSAGTLGDGLDTRGGNGYVLAEGSVIDGKPYRWVGQTGAPEAAVIIDDTSPLFAPLASLGRHGKRSDAGEIVVDELDHPANIAEALGWLNNTHEPCIEGSADTNALVAAQFMREFGLSPEVAAETMFYSEWNQNAVDKNGNKWPWKLSEIEEKIENAWRYAQNPAGCRAVTGNYEFKMAQPDSGPTFEQLQALSMAKVEEDARELRDRIEGDFLRGNQVTAGICEPKWLIDGVIPDNGVGILAAREKTGKTFIAIDAALHVATGRAWNGRSVQQGAVLYMAAEYGEGVRRRVATWCHHNECEVPEGFHLLPRNYDILNDEKAKTLIHYCRENDIRFIIVDTLTRALAGRDGNSSEVATAFTNRASELADASGAVLLAIGHMAKGKSTEQSILGSVVFQANADFVMYLNKNEGSDTVSLVEGVAREEGCGPLHFKPLAVQMPGWEKPGRVFVPASEPDEAQEQEGPGLTLIERTIILKGVRDYLSHPACPAHAQGATIANDLCTQPEMPVADKILSVIKAEREKSLKPYLYGSDKHKGALSFTPTEKQLK